MRFRKISVSSPVILFWASCHKTRVWGLQYTSISTHPGHGNTSSDVSGCTICVSAQFFLWSDTKSQTATTPRGFLWELLSFCSDMSKRTLLRLNYNLTKEEDILHFVPPQSQTFWNKRTASPALVWTVWSKQCLYYLYSASWQWTLLLSSVRQRLDWIQYTYWA